MGENAVRERVQEPEAYVIVCLMQGAWEQALALIDELGDCPGYAPHLAQAAARLAAGREWDAAARCAGRAVALDPGCAAAHRLLGELHLAKGEEAAAEASLARAAALDGMDVAATVALAALYLQQGRPEQACPYVEAAVEAAPGDEAARDVLRRLRKAVGPARAEALHRLAARAQARRASARRPSLSLCLIVRNEARNLPRVAQSVRDLATEIVVVDTGSTDQTVAIARTLGARVASFPWVDDFAAARNQSLALATGEWILVLDADDELDRAAVPALRQWLAGAGDGSPPGAVEVVGLYRRYPHPGMQRDSISIQPRLFRNGRGIRFVGAIHEQVVRADGRAAVPDVTLTAMIHHHSDMSEPGAVQRRLDRNLRILLRSLEKHPDDPRERFYAGLTLFNQEKWSDAVPHLRAALAAAHAAGPEPLDFVPKAYACLGDALLKSSRPVEAESLLREGLEHHPKHPELWFCLGMVLDALGRLEEAVAAHEAALTGRFGASMNWHDWSCREEKPHIALADLKLALGDPEAAGRHLDAAEAFTGPQPFYPSIRGAIAQAVAAQESLREQQARDEAAAEAGDLEAGLRLIASLLEQGMVERAHDLAQAWRERWGEAPELLVAVGRVSLASGEAGRARDCFVQARELRPDWPVAWEGEAQACRALGSLHDAEEALLRAQPLQPHAGELAHALGELYLAEERWDDAARCFRESLEEDEARWPSWLGLGAAMLRSGNLPVAVNCYQRAATASGGHAAVRVALGDARAWIERARDEG